MAAPTVPVSPSSAQDSPRLYTGNLIASLFSTVERVEKQGSSSPLTIDEVLDGSRRSR
jgi:hypothetical protein